jgi:hypothetical protein
MAQIDIDVLENIPIPENISKEKIIELINLVNGIIDGNEDLTNDLNKIVNDLYL